MTLVEEIFKPYDYSVFGIKSIGKPPFGEVSATILNNVSYNVVIPNEHGVIHESIPITSFAGNDNRSFENLKISVNYSELQKSVEQKKYESVVRRIIYFLGYEYRKQLEMLLLNADTNIQASKIFQAELNKIEDSYISLYLLNKEGRTPYELILVEEFFGSVKSLSENICRSYKDAFGNAINDFKSNIEYELQPPTSNDNIIYGNGIILMNGLSMTASRAKELCHSLKTKGYIRKGTRYETLQNIFKNSVNENVTAQVCWKKSIAELKYFINGLHLNEIICESNYQKKWLDAANCFYKDGIKIKNTTFSNNTETVPKESKEVLNQILAIFTRSLAN
nr:hypothetical protein [uncultured Allomuricauda sp.]